MKTLDEISGHWPEDADPRLWQVAAFPERVMMDANDEWQAYRRARQIQYIIKNIQLLRP